MSSGEPTATCSTTPVTRTRRRQRSWIAFIPPLPIRPTVLPPDVPVLCGTPTFSVVLHGTAGRTPEIGRCGAVRCGTMPVRRESDGTRAGHRNRRDRGENGGRRIRVYIDYWDAYTSSRQLFAPPGA